MAGQAGGFAETAAKGGTLAVSLATVEGMAPSPEAAAGLSEAVVLLSPTQTLIPGMGREKTTPAKTLGAMGGEVAKKPIEFPIGVTQQDLSHFLKSLDREIISEIKSFLKLKSLMIKCKVTDSLKWFQDAFLCSLLNKNQEPFALRHLNTNKEIERPETTTCYLSEPSCLKLMTVMKTEEMANILMYVLHAIQTALEPKGGHCLSSNKTLQYQTAVLKQNKNTLETPPVANSAMSLPLVLTEGFPEHGCLQTAEEVYSSKSDLKDVFPEESGHELYAHGSNSMRENQQVSCHAVAAADKVIEAQKDKQIALTRVHGAGWKEQRLMTAQGNEILEQTLAFLKNIWKPARRSILHCKLENHFAVFTVKETAKKSILAVFSQREIDFAELPQKEKLIILLMLGILNSGLNWDMILKVGVPLETPPDKRSHFTVTVGVGIPRNLHASCEPCQIPHILKKIHRKRVRKKKVDMQSCLISLSSIFQKAREFVRPSGPVKLDIAVNLFLPGDWVYDKQWDISPLQAKQRRLFQVQQNHLRYNRNG